MGRVVILEGPDGGGKTSLAKKLMKAGFEYKHEGPPPVGVDLLAFYLRKLWESLKSNRNVVHDRLWLGERIYGPIARDTDRIGMEGQILFERIRKSKTVDQYICYPDYTVSKTNYLIKIQESGDVLKSVDLWDKAYKGYEDWLTTSGKPGDRFNYSIHSHEKILEDILSSSRAMNCLPEGSIGSPEAKFLFIGDKPNHLSIDVPFFATNGSSGYLNRALVMAGIKEEDLALSNAKSPVDEEHSLGLMLSRLPKLEHIFVMGAVAKEWFYKSTNIKTAYKVSCVPHPSYLKRFKGHDSTVMANIITKELRG